MQINGRVTTFNKTSWEGAMPYVGCLVQATNICYMYVLYSKACALPHIHLQLVACTCTHMYMYISESVQEYSLLM